MEAEKTNVPHFPWDKMEHGKLKRKQQKPHKGALQYRTSI
jgi:hypothetical protein